MVTLWIIYMISDANNKVVLVVYASTLAPVVTRGALTFPRPIRACVETDRSSLSENRRRWLGEVVQLVGPESRYGRKLQGRSLLLHFPLRPDGVNQSSAKMSASAQAISDWNKWQMGVLLPLFNQFHQMWFYLL